MVIFWWVMARDCLKEELCSQVLSQQLPGRRCSRGQPYAWQARVWMPGEAGRIVMASLKQGGGM